MLNDLTSSSIARNVRQYLFVSICTSLAIFILVESYAIAIAIYNNVAILLKGNGYHSDIYDVFLGIAESLSIISVFVGIQIPDEDYPNPNVVALLGILFFSISGITYLDYNFMNEQFLSTVQALIVFSTILSFWYFGSTLRVLSRSIQGTRTKKTR